MTKEEVMTAIRGCAEKMGRVPTFAEVRRATKLSKHAIRKNFISYARALGECGLERRGPGYEAAASALFLDWAGLVRQLGKLPTMAEYEMHGSYSVRPLVRRYGGWTHVPAGMLEYAKKRKTGRRMGGRTGRCGETQGESGGTGQDVRAEGWDGRLGE